MPDLLTITVTDAQHTLILAAFGNDQAVMEAWTRDRIVSHVLEQEQKRMAAEALAEQRAALEALRTELA